MHATARANLISAPPWSSPRPAGQRAPFRAARAGPIERAGRGVVPPRDPLALAAALDALLALGVDERARVGRAARAHIARHYALGEVTERYQRLYCEVAAERSAR